MAFKGGWVKKFRLPTKHEKDLVNILKILDPGEKVTITYLGHPYDCYEVSFNRKQALDDFSIGKAIKRLEIIDGKDYSP